jgi:hypothetical protein
MDPCWTPKPKPKPHLLLLDFGTRLDFFEIEKMKIWKIDSNMMMLLLVHILTWGMIPSNHFNVFSIGFDYCYI